MCMVFMGGHVSGAHYNPAVTFGVFLRGRISRGLAIWYVLAQLAGGFTGALLSYLATGYHPYPKPGDGEKPDQFVWPLFPLTNLIYSIV